MLSVMISYLLLLLLFIVLVLCSTYVLKIFFKLLEEDCTYVDSRPYVFNSYTFLFMLKYCLKDKGCTSSVCGVKEIHVEEHLNHQCNGFMRAHTSRP